MGTKQSKPQRDPIKIPHEEKSIEQLLAELEIMYQSTETSSDSISDHDEVIFYKDTNDSVSLITMTEHVKEMDSAELHHFWEYNSKNMLHMIKTIPEQCISLRLHHIQKTIQTKYMKELAILIFHTNINDALMLLDGNSHAASHLYRSIDLKRSKLLLSTKNLSNIAYQCRSHHEYGLSHMLFRMSKEDKAAKDIIDMFASDYVKMLLS